MNEKIEIAVKQYLTYEDGQTLKDKVVFPSDDDRWLSKQEKYENGTIYRTHLIPEICRYKDKLYLAYRTNSGLVISAELDMDLYTIHKQPIATDKK